MTNRVYFYAYLIAFFFSLSSVAFVQAQAPAPVFKEGDTWQVKWESKGYRGTSTDRLDGIYEITFVQGGLKLYEIEGGTGRGGGDTNPDRDR